MTSEAKTAPPPDCNLKTAKNMPMIELMIVKHITTNWLSIGKMVLQTNFIQYLTMMHSKNVKIMKRMLKWTIRNWTYPIHIGNLMSNTLANVLKFKVVMFDIMKMAYKLEKSCKNWKWLRNLTPVRNLDGFMKDNSPDQLFFASRGLLQTDQTGSIQKAIHCQTLQLESRGLQSQSFLVLSKKYQEWWTLNV